ncbi:MAG: surface lipoprotein assembly modifier [Parahaliea sp.]
MQRSARVITALLSLLCATVQAAQNSDKRQTRFSAEVAIGAEYDSNVAIDELDTSSSKSDNALTLDADLSLKTALSEHTELNLSYDFSQNIYQDFGELNRQTHILGTSIEQDFERIDTGLSLFYISSLLDGDSFLTLYRISPSLSGFIGKKWFGRSALVYSDKSLEQNSDRDAQTHTVELDLYYFARGLRSYINVGYRYKDENAEAEHYDYGSNGIKLRYIHRFELPSRTLKLELAWRYEDRHYRHDTPAINRKRSDQRQRWQLDVEIPILKNSAVQLYSSYGNYDSNYWPADYDQLVTGSRFIHRW